MRELYPNTEPRAIRRWAVTPPHELYVEECGTPSGTPVVFLHGLGAGSEPFHRRFFDPRRYRTILLEQRGCGRSIPGGDLVANDTPSLVADLEALRLGLGIERWLLFGLAWGTTLALTYAETYPAHVRGLILSGTFLGRPKEISWLYQEGASRVFPDYWRDFLAPIPGAERDNLLQAYYRRLRGQDELARLAAAKAWAQWAGRIASLLPSPEPRNRHLNSRSALYLARLQSHFLVHRVFLEPDQLLRNVERLAGIPGILIQGRYDLVTPLESAWELHQAWPGSRLRIVADAGHAASEPGVLSALVEAADEFAELA